MSIKTTASTLAVTATALLFCACASGGAGAPGGRAPGGEAMEAQELVPAGYGTLRQDDFTILLRSGSLLIKVTPLAESIIRLAAPDTYDRLTSLVQGRIDALRRESMSDDPSLFFVSFFSYDPDVTYQPEDLQLENRGLRYRPRGIEPVTPGWGAQRLGQQETQMAIYAFDRGIDLETDLAVQYGAERNAGWEHILPVLQAERAKVRARAGTQGSQVQSSRPYFRIFR